ncbi:MAG: alanine--tRNA ligase [bacterium]|nr:alanine--tRNA ligase [bacterium]
MNICTTKRKRKTPIKTADIRQSFLDYFVHHDHKLIPSSPVIPFEDPTILFTNAGMNQFKDIFTGQRKVDYKRATSSQKCIRAGGKHNDLDNVGFTARHHTFFEMMGNFSFGDYFKEQAILYAWEWITKEIKLPTDKLYVSVYETDDDAFELWEKIAPELRNGRVMRFGKKDNYWSMGEFGPCGPSSEIHIDRGEKYGTGPDDVVNGDGERFVEFWNLVFMEQDQLPDGKLTDLPFCSVDTGLGLERMAAILQGVDSNYGIDLFQNLIRAVSELTSTKYGDNVTSHHVIADHIRALSFAIADGAGISNEGQGYVLRRILRRAARHGRLLGMQEPFIYKLVPVLVNEMSEAFPELNAKQSHLENVIKAEEESFGRTLDTGLELFEKAAAGANGKTIDGATVFRLYDTYGFPFDLTEILASEKGLSLDKAGFDRAMEEQKEKSRGASKMNAEAASIPTDWNAPTPSEFYRHGLTTSAKVVDKLELGPQIGIVIDRTPFYVESGGQTSDAGHIVGPDFDLRVELMIEHQGAYLHLGEFVKGGPDDIRIGEKVAAEVNAERRWDIMRNHTATHLTQAALRKVLGEHIKQSGSYVGPDRLRFDFSHHQPMTPNQILEVEKIVNGQIIAGTAVNTEADVPVDKAKEMGAMALFGEKYGDTVRVVSVTPDNDEGPFSIELCGGTHVTNTGQIGPYIITLETGIASGVRRMEAITGREAIKFMLEAKEYQREVSSIVNRQESDSLEAVRQLREQNSTLQKEIKKLKENMFAGAAPSGESRSKGAVRFVSYEFGETDRDTMSAWADKQKESAEPVFAIGYGIVGAKATVMTAASKAAVTKQAVHVGNLTKELLSRFGGRGGGKLNFAQGSVADGTDTQKLFDAAFNLLPGA